MTKHEPIKVELFSFYSAVATYNEPSDSWDVKYPWGVESLKGDRASVETAMWEELDLRA